MPPDNRMSLKERLGLHRPELRAWAMYDWANSAMVTLIVTAVFPIFYKRVAADGLSDPVADYRFSIATTIALAVSAVLSPLLGTVADYAAAKKRYLGLFLALGAVATAMMFFIQSGMWLAALVLFALSNIGANGSFVFYDALLPHVARPEEMDLPARRGSQRGLLLRTCYGIMPAQLARWARPHHTPTPDRGPSPPEACANRLVSLPGPPVSAIVAGWVVAR